MSVLKNTKNATGLWGSKWAHGEKLMNSTTTHTPASLTSLPYELLLEIFQEVDLTLLKHFRLLSPLYTASTEAWSKQVFNTIYVRADDQAIERLRTIAENPQSARSVQTIVFWVPPAPALGRKDYCPDPHPVIESLTTIFAALAASCGRKQKSLAFGIHTDNEVFSTCNSYYRDVATIYSKLVIFAHQAAQDAGIHITGLKLRMSERRLSGFEKLVQRLALIRAGIDIEDKHFEGWQIRPNFDLEVKTHVIHNIHGKAYKGSSTCELIYTASENLFTLKGGDYPPSKDFTDTPNYQVERIQSAFGSILDLLKTVYHLPDVRVHEDPISEIVDALLEAIPDDPVYE